MVGLTVAALWGLERIDAEDSSFGWAVWMLALFAFYLSLCCAFFPAPTSWIVLLAASDLVARQIGVADYWMLHGALVVTIGAAATGIANLNEYHIFIFLLRHGRAARIRDTRLYRVASRWFYSSPFWIIMLFSFVPLPVDVIRWLAITAAYPRWPFFWAYFIGRWFRYSLFAVAALSFDLKVWQIVLIQVALVAVALLRIVPRLARRWQGNHMSQSEPRP